jgi:hypothetical protein
MAEVFKYRVNCVPRRKSYKSDEFHSLEEALDHGAWLDRRLCGSILVLRIGEDGASLIMDQATINAWAQENHHPSLDYDDKGNLLPQRRAL